MQGCHGEVQMWPGKLVIGVIKRMFWEKLNKCPALSTIKVSPLKRRPPVEYPKFEISAPGVYLRIWSYFLFNVGSR